MRINTLNHSLNNNLIKQKSQKQNRRISFLKPEPQKTLTECLKMPGNLKYEYKSRIGGSNYTRNMLNMTFALLNKPS